MINIKGKKKEKDKEGEKEKQKEKKKKQKKAASSDDIAAESPDLPLHGKMIFNHFFSIFKKNAKKGDQTSYKKKLKSETPFGNRSYLSNKSFVHNTILI